VSTIKMGIAPIALAVSPVNETVYVVNGGQNEVWVYNPGRQSIVAKIPVGEAPDGIAITPDGKKLFVANSRSNDLTVIDAQSNKVLVTLPVGKRPFGVAVSPDGKNVFVVNTESRTVSVLPVDLSSLEARSIQVEKGPVDIKVLPDSRTVVVVNEQSHSLIIASVPSLAVDKPAGESPDPFLDGRRRFISQDPLRTGDVGVRDLHVARLWRQELEPGLLAEGILQISDQLQQLGGPRLAQVQDLESRIDLERSHDPGDDVIRVGVIPARGAVAVNRDLPVLPQQLGEFVNGHFGPLPRAVDREEAEAGDVHPVVARIGVAEQFTRLFGGGVG